MKDVYSTKEAAEFLGVTKNHVIRLIKSGKLIASNIGLGQRAIWRISYDEINRFLRINKKQSNEQPRDSEN